MIDDMITQGLSARAACQWAGTSRAITTYELKLPEQDAARLRKLRRVTRKNPRYGYTCPNRRCGSPGSHQK